MFRNILKLYITQNMKEYLFEYFLLLFAIEKGVKHYQFKKYLKLKYLNF